MKTKLILLALAIVMSGAVFAKKQTVVFDVTMHCESCQKKIEKNIAFEKGVSDMKVNLEKKSVEIVYEDTKTNTDKLIKAFKKLGYEAKIVSESI